MKLAWEFHFQYRCATNHLHLYVTNYYIFFCTIPSYSYSYSYSCQCQYLLKYYIYNYCSILPNQHRSSAPIFLLISRMLIYIILLLSITIIFLHFGWPHKPCQWKVLPFGLAIFPRVFTSLTEPILFLCQSKGLCYYTFGLFPGPDLLKACCQEGMNPLLSLWILLGLHTIFSRSDLCLTQHFSF